MTPRTFAAVVKAFLAAEGLTALALVAVTVDVARLLLGSELAAAGIAMARAFGIALAALVLAVGPRR